MTSFQKILYQIQFKDGGADEFEEFRSSIGRRKARDGPEKKELTPAVIKGAYRDG